MEGPDSLTCRISCKIKAAGGRKKMLGDTGPVLGPLCHVRRKAQVHAEFLRTKLMEFLLLCLLLCRSEGTGRNKENACESALAGKQSSRQRKMRLTASGVDYCILRSWLLLHLSRRKKDELLSHAHRKEKKKKRKTMCVHQYNL